MSVVHRMLQNLDARGAAPSVPGLSPGPATTPASARWRLPLIGAAGAAAAYGARAGLRVHVVMPEDTPAANVRGQSTPPVSPCHHGKSHKLVAC